MEAEVIKAELVLPTHMSFKRIKMHEKYPKGQSKVRWKQLKQILQAEITKITLLKNPIEIWDEVGENDEERDKMLLQIEQECLDVYKGKVEQAAKSRAQLLQALLDAKFELSTLVSTLRDRSFVGIVSNHLIVRNASE